MSSFREDLVTSPLSPSIAACGIDVLNVRPFVSDDLRKRVVGEQERANSMPPVGALTRAPTPATRRRDATNGYTEKRGRGRGGRNATGAGRARLRCAARSVSFRGTARCVRAFRIAP